MTIVRSLLLFAVAALGAYGFVATFQPDPHSGRVLAAYGGIFVAGSLAWSIMIDKFRPEGGRAGVSFAARPAAGRRRRRPCRTARR